ncbi:MAG: LamG-like jellyroll fold domain-containing protein [Candidatus Paceibacterota bacterium]|jgi:prepilin-type N-terminal cleavage/methylation domain-containing protein
MNNELRVKNKEMKIKNCGEPTIHNSLFAIHCSRRSGFTLIELLVTISLVSIIAVVSTLSLGGYRGQQNLKRTLDEMSSVIQDAQKRAVTQQNGSQWGVHFLNSTSINSYSMFEGVSYALGTSTNTYGLPRGIQFSNPFSSSTYDAIFSGITGNLSGKKVISLITGRKDNLVGDIVLNTLGKATPRFDSGLVGYWHFDEGTATTTYDASGNSNTGTLLGSPTWQSILNCKAGGCLTFNGATNYVNVGNSNASLGFSNDFTLSAWVFPTAYHTTGYYGILNGFIARGPASTYNYVLETKNDTTVTFIKRTGVESLQFYDFIVPSMANKWTHITMTISSNLIAKLYINGIFSSQQTIVGTIAAVAGDTLYLGGATGNQSETYFIGSVDEVKIYNRALSAAEVLAHYNDLK